MRKKLVICILFIFCMIIGTIKVEAAAGEQMYGYDDMLKYADGSTDRNIAIGELDSVSKYAKYIWGPITKENEWDVQDEGTGLLEYEGLTILYRLWVGGTDPVKGTVGKPIYLHMLFKGDPDDIDSDNFMLHEKNTGYIDDESVSFYSAAQVRDKHTGGFDDCWIYEPGWLADYNVQETVMEFTPIKAGRFTFSVFFVDDNGDEIPMDLRITVEAELSKEDKLSQAIENAVHIPWAYRDPQSNTMVLYCHRDLVKNNGATIAFWDEELLKRALEIVEKDPQIDHYVGIYGDQYKNIYNGVKESLEDAINKIELAKQKNNKEELTEEERKEIVAESAEAAKQANALLQRAITSWSDKPRDVVKFIDALYETDKYLGFDKLNEEEAYRLSGKLSVILTIITNIGVIVSVLILAVIGIKYMFASVEEKAEYKKDMVPYLVGAILLFGICSILRILEQVGQSMNNI